MYVDGRVGSASLFPLSHGPPSFKREANFPDRVNQGRGRTQRKQAKPPTACPAKHVEAHRSLREHWEVRARRGWAGPPPSPHRCLRSSSLKGETEKKKKASLGKDTVTLLTTGLDGLSYCLHQRSSSDPGEKLRANSEHRERSFCISGSLFFCAT